MIHRKKYRPRTSCAANVLLLLLPFLLANGSYAAERLVPAQYETIQAAIDAAAEGDAVIVSPGTYVENLVLKSGVDVRGVEVARTMLMPEVSGDPVMLVSQVDDLIVGNLTIVGARIGVDLIDSRGLKIVNMVLDTATQIGIRVDENSQVDILNVVFWSNGVAVNRATENAKITNSAFVNNNVTLASPIVSNIDPNTNVDNCGFFNNADLAVSGVDTGLGTNPRVADARFVATDERDFHLLEGSAFIDSGVGLDVIDNSTADIGAYGGQFADERPFVVAAPAVNDVSGTSPPPYSVELMWEANLSYLVSNSTNAGSYRVYYQQNQSGPPYAGDDAGNGTLPSPVEAGDATSLLLTDLQPLAPVPASPQLLSAVARQNSVALEWTEVDGAANYRVYWGIGSVDDASADTGNVTTFSVPGLDNGTSYRFAVSALRQSVYYFGVTALDNTPDRNESVVSEESTLALGPLFEGAQSNQLTASPAETLPYPNLPDEGCFIATAAFGADWLAEVLTLRDFRDEFLLTNRAGRAFVKWYYRHGPEAAIYIREHDGLRPVVRFLLSPLVLLALVALNISWPVVFVLAALVLALRGARMQSRRVGMRRALSR